MTRHQLGWTNSILIAAIFMSFILSNYNVQAYNRRKFQNDQSKRELLRYFLRRLENLDNKQLDFGTRAEEGSECSTDFLHGYVWSQTSEISGQNGIPTLQRCLDMCDIDVTCVGWSYNPNTKLCWKYTSIAGVHPAESADDIAGSCIGKSVKAECKEILNGQYPISTLKDLQDIDTVENCMKKCDEEPLCYGWRYAASEKQCSLGREVFTFQEGDYFKSGSCVASQKRVHIAEPLKIFRKEGLERHNDLREKHCTSALTLDTDLNKQAQDLADQLAQADMMPPTYSSDNMVNVYYGRAIDERTCASIVDCFYDEQKYYNWTKPDFSKTNHFPKVIWESSTKLGVGKAHSNDKQTMYIVMNYDAKDDLTDSYSDNVKAKCK